MQRNVVKRGLLGALQICRLSMCNGSCAVDCAVASSPLRQYGRKVGGFSPMLSRGGKKKQQPQERRPQPLPHGLRRELSRAGWAGGLQPGRSLLDQHPSSLMQLLQSAALPVRKQLSSHLVERGPSDQWLLELFNGRLLAQRECCGCQESDGLLIPDAYQSKLLDANQPVDFQRLLLHLGERKLASDKGQGMDEGQEPKGQHGIQNPMDERQPTSEQQSELDIESTLQQGGIAGDVEGAMQPGNLSEVTEEPQPTFQELMGQLLDLCRKHNEHRMRSVEMSDDDGFIGEEEKRKGPIARYYKDVTSESEASEGEGATESREEAGEASESGEGGEETDDAKKPKKKPEIEDLGVYYTGEGERIDTRISQLPVLPSGFVTGDGKSIPIDPKEQQPLDPIRKPPSGGDKPEQTEQPQKPTKAESEDEPQQ